MSDDSLFIKVLKSPARLFAGSKTTVNNQNIQPEPSWSARGHKLSKEDLEEARRIIYSEVSNREPTKQELEARIILNTAINRMGEYKSKGQQVTLSDVFKMPNQYQGYNSPQYKLYSNQQANVLSARKKFQTDSIVDKMIKEIETNQFQDNTGGAFYYQHKGDKIYYDDKKPLFRSNQI